MVLRSTGSQANSWLPFLLATSLKLLVPQFLLDVPVACLLPKYGQGISIKIEDQG